MTERHHRLEVGLSTITMPLNKVAIAVSSELAAEFNVPANNGLFDLTSYAQPLFNIILKPDGYVPTYNELGESGVIVGAGASVVLAPRVQYQIELSSVESRNSAIVILNRIYHAARQGSSYAPITVLDYHALDTSTDVLQGYTLRYMAMSLPPQRQGGSFRDKGVNFGPGGYHLTLVSVA